MKKKSILLAAALVSCFAAKGSAETVGDTLVIEEAKKVRIETRDTVQRIIISGMKDEDLFQYTQRISLPNASAVRRNIGGINDVSKIVVPSKDDEDSKWDSSIHMLLGMNLLLDTPDEYEFRLWPSFDLGFAWLADWHPYGKCNEWSIGLGISLRSYGYKNDHYLGKVGDMLTPIAYTDEMENRSSALGIASLQLPLLYTHYFDQRQRLGITLGAIVNWNFYAQSSRNYEVGDEDFSITTKKIGHHPFTVDALAVFHIPSFVDIYCKYCPMKLFKNGRGPEAHQLSFGIYL